MKNRVFAAFLAVVFLAPSVVLRAQPRQKLQVLGADELSKLLPASVFLDGQNAPVQKRNAVGARMPNNKVVIVTLVDTSGYSAAYQEKYEGALLTQGVLIVGTKEVKPGAYGLGRKKTVAGAREPAAFVLYDLGGSAVVEVPATKDEKLRPVTPIQLKPGDGPAAQLYLGADFVTLSSRESSLEFW